VSGMLDSERREFCRKAAGGVALGALAALTGIPVRRRQVTPAASHRCTQESRCWNCGVYATCVLPQAVTRRLAKGRG
jgi:hypothetical protein